MTNKAIKIVPTLLLCLLCLQPVQASHSDYESKTLSPTPTTQRMPIQDFEDEAMSLDPQSVNDESSATLPEFFRTMNRESSSSSNSSTSSNLSEAPPNFAQGTLSPSTLEEKIKQAEFKKTQKEEDLKKLSAFIKVYKKKKALKKAIYLSANPLAKGLANAKIAAKGFSVTIAGALITSFAWMLWTHGTERTYKQMKTEEKLMGNGLAISVSLGILASSWEGVKIQPQHLKWQLEKATANWHKSLESNRPLTNQQKKQLYQQTETEFLQKSACLAKKTEILNNLYSARRIAYAKSLIPWNWKTPTIPTIPNAPNAKDVAKNVAVKNVAVNLGNKIPVAAKVVLGGASLFALFALVAMKLIAKEAHQ